MPLYKMVVVDMSGASEEEIINHIEEIGRDFETRVYYTSESDAIEASDPMTTGVHRVLYQCIGEGILLPQLYETLLMNYGFSPDVASEVDDGIVVEKTSTKY